MSQVILWKFYCTDALTLFSKLWSFLVTGTVSKHELKIWSTQSWSCLQTVTLLVPPTTGLVGGHDSYLQVSVDLSASYLVLCDIARKVTFHLLIDKGKRYCIAVNGSIPWHSYGVSLAIWDHTVLPATRHKWTHPGLTPARQVGTWFTYPRRMEGWVDLRDQLHTEMIYRPTDGHPSKY